MNVQHRELAQGRWFEMPFMLQMANTASEVERSLKWQEKENKDSLQKASERAIELMDLTAADPKNKSRLRELVRVRELFTDYLFGDNEYQSTAKSWRSYFSQFTFAARRQH